jgi:PAS domain S-box-containing protein
VLATAIEIALHKHRLQSSLLTDITRALRESEIRYHQLVQNIPDHAIALLDNRGHILDWNPGAESIFGYPANEIVGQNIASLFPPEAVDGHKPTQLLTTAREQGRFHEQLWHLRKDRTTFWGDTTVVALKEQNGDMFSFLTVAREMFV